MAAEKLPNVGDEVDEKPAKFVLIQVRNYLFLCKSIIKFKMYFKNCDQRDHTGSILISDKDFFKLRFCLIDSLRQIF